MKHVQVHVLLVCSVLALQSCRDSPTAPPSASTPWMSQLLAVINQNNENFAAPGAPQLPEDLSTHAQSGAESFSFQAVLSLADGLEQPASQVIAGVSVRLDRVALPLDVQALSADSAWRYNGIMRSSAFFDTNIAQLEIPAREDADEGLVQQLADLSAGNRTQSVQRMAIDLAGLSSNELWIGDDRLTISGLDVDSDSCARDYRWEVALSAVDRLELNVSMSECPQISAFSTFNNWQQTSAEVTGELFSDRAGTLNVSTSVEGALWMSQSWGNFPATLGAVAIDTLQIRLDDARWLNVSRSKRRSGRGPETVSAVLHSTDSLPIDIDMTWQDSNKQVMSVSGNRYPDSIQLRSPKHSLALTVSALNRLSEVSEFGGRRLDIPVTVSGVQTGAGFLSFHALTP